MAKDSTDAPAKKGASKKAAESSAPPLHWSAAESLPLPWQAAPWQRVLQQLESRQLPHALLLAGPPAVGKRRFASALCATLLCLEPARPEGVACGRCRACLLRLAGTHPDAHWIAPEESGKMIKIDQVRAVVEFVAQTAQQGGRKVVVLEPAEAMNRSSANALLKTLEEPAGAATLILLADAPGRLLPTIRSRCQRIDFPVPPEAEVRRWLQARAADPAALDAAILDAGGRPMLASTLLDGAEGDQRRELANELEQVLAGRLSVPTLAERWQQLPWIGLLEWLATRVAAALRTRLAGMPAPDAAVRHLAAAEAEALFALDDHLRDRLNQVRGGGNPNVQLALEVFLFNACEAVNKKSP
jgi:DNA polymerase-3 subunit delta'